MTTMEYWYYPDDMTDPYWEYGYMLGYDNDLETVIKGVMIWINQLLDNELTKDGDQKITKIKMINQHFIEYENDIPERDPIYDTFILAEMTIETFDEDIIVEDDYRLVIRKIL